jgi:hypothetical protein
MASRNERRKAERHVVSFPVALESEGRYVFSTRARDMASTGLLVMMAAELKVGQPVVITYSSVGGENPWCDVEGRIVRVERNTGQGKHEWPFLAAVEFSGPVSELPGIPPREPADGEDREPPRKRQRP